MTMWPLTASGGWLPARGYLHSESVNAQRMRPYMPGGRWRGGPYKRGTTVYNIYNFISSIKTWKCIMHSEGARYKHDHIHNKIKQ